MHPSSSSKLLKFIPYFYLVTSQFSTKPAPKLILPQTQLTKIAPKTGLIFDTVSLSAKMATYTLAELNLMNGQNEPQDNIFKARLEEYKQLSQSNLDLHTGRRHLLLIAGIITGAMFTAGFQFKRPEVFLFASLLLILFWYQDMRMRNAIIKRRAFIEVKIETA